MNGLDSAMCQNPRFEDMEGINKIVMIIGQKRNGVVFFN